MRKGLLFILLLGFSFKLFAQSGQFSPVPAQFIVEFESFIKKANDKSLNRNFGIFKENWELGKFSPSQQKFIVDISNQMLLEKMSVQPHFELFITTVAAFLENKMPDKVLVQWQKITQSLIGDQNKEYLDFLQTTAVLFSKKILYQGGSSIYSVDTLDFDMSYKGEIVFTFNNVTLSCKGVADKMEVKATSGTYYPAKKMWKGTSGKAGFERVLGDETAWVSFGKYQIAIDQNSYSVDTVLLNYPRFFKEPIMGRFKDKLSTDPDSNRVKNSGFPVFNSFSNSLNIRGIVGDESFFVGGFSMQGKSITTATADGRPSNIDVFYKGKKQVTLRSPSFKIVDGLAGSLNCEFFVYLDSGNVIYHPNVKTSFYFDKNLLLIERGEQGLMRVPFRDDYHKITFDVQQIRWKVKEPFMDMDNINNDQEARFASEEFFKDILYLRMQGMLASNPIENIYAYYNRMPPDPVADKLQKDIKKLMTSKNPADKVLMDQKIKELQERKKAQRASFKSSERIKFNINDYAQFIGSQKEYLITPFIELHDQGYIVYDQAQDSATILPKLWRHVQAHQKTRDYDVIRLASVIGKKPNGTLNLLSYELDLEGVNRFFFSDSQNVIVAPTDQKVTMLKNRNLRFGGQVRAGRFDFFGKKFNFDYSQFKIQFSNVDSIQMYFPDSTGRRLVKIKSVIRNTSGTLYIDKPNNKSGVKDYPEYPIFVSDKGSEVLYDKSHIHGGAYTADKFKFVMDPFTIDSLDNFTIAGLRFDGNFISAGIFPEFRHHVYIQKDYSLGFIKSTPPGGYAMYRGKAVGNMTMNLSEEGFYGEAGEIAYQGGKSTFSRVLLLPNQTKGELNSYDLPESPKYPEIHGVNVALDWRPYEDKYTVSSGKKPIDVFKQGYDFTGSLTQSPLNIKGDGMLAWDLAQFSSKEMVFATQKAMAQVASLKIFAADSAKVAFNTTNINGTMDFSKRVGTFSTNDADQMTQFAYNNFQTNLSDYRWDMDKKIITAKVGPTLGSEPPMFVSTNPLQEGLNFEAKRADYSLVDYTLKVQQIPHIDIADSRLFLKDGKLTIRENANIDIVDSAKIIANVDDKYHEIYKTRLKIYGLNKVRGSGYYQYVNLKGVRQEFFLDSVIVNREKHIEGIGKIAEEQGFTLDTKIGYKGFGQIESTEPLIRFTGYVKPLHTFKNILPSAWIRFDGRVDPKDVVIPMNDPRDYDNKKQYVGLFVANDSSHVYPLMYSWKRRYSDDDCTNDTGILYYDHTTESFMAGNAARLRGGSLKGSYIQFCEKDHSIHAEGPLDFGLESPNIQFKNAGTADLAAKDSAFSFNMAMMLNFPLPDEYVKRMTTIISESSTPSVSVNNNFFREALGEMMESDKSYKNALESLMKDGQFRGKDEANYMFVMTDANFRWEAKLRGMYCTDVVSIASISGTPVNKGVKATMLLEHKRSGDNMYIYFDLGNNESLYMQLTKTTVTLYSSDEELTQIFAKTSSKLKADNFYMRMATEKQVERFLRKLSDYEEE